MSFSKVHMMIALSCALATAAPCLATDDDDVVLYGMDAVLDNLNTISLRFDNPGVATASLPLSADAVSAGLAYDPATRTMFISNTPLGPSIRSVDLDTGTVTSIGNNPSNLVSGLAWNAKDNILYTCSNSGLSTFDPDAGSGTGVGPVFIDDGSGGMITVDPTGCGLAYDNLNGVLYMASRGTGAGSALYTVDPATGQATLVGLFGSNFNNAGLAYHPAHGLILSTQGSSFQEGVYWIDTSTAAPTLLGLMLDTNALAFVSRGVAPLCAPDINGDGVVDTADLGILIGVFGTTCP